MKRLLNGIKTKKVEIIISLFVDNSETAMKNVIVCGSLCNTDMAVAELLSRHNIFVKVLRHSSEKLESETHLSGSLRYFSLDKIIYVSSPKEAAEFLKRARLIVSLTGAVDTFLRFRNIFLRNFIVLRKTINITTGADITELARLNTPQGKRFRSLLKRSSFNFFNPYPESINSLKKIGINNFQIIKPPYYLLPKLVNIKVNKEKKREKIQFFMPSGLDWGVTDNKFKRNTTKGNNRFLNAFIKAVKTGMNIHCTILDRGSDKELAKKIIQESGCTFAFDVLPEVNQGDLVKQIAQSDIIVDQFDVGFAGGIAYEAMAQAKPVMIHINNNCWPLVYDEEPPVINCHTEDEIYNAILKWSDRKKLQTLGKKAEKWVRKYQDIHITDFSELILRVCLAAGLEWPRLDLAKGVK